MQENGRWLISRHLLDFVLECSLMAIQMIEKRHNIKYNEEKFMANQWGDVASDIDGEMQAVVRRRQSI